MKIFIRGNEVHVATGGKAHQEGKKFVVFLHGAGNSHLTWVSQSRAIAYDGYNVIAPDMPGHNLSAGDPIEGIEAQADWYVELLKALDCKGAVLVGHSQGGIIAMEIARKAPELVAGIGFVATAAAIPVNDMLINMAEKKQDRAISSMTSWGLGPQSHMHDNTWPGASNVFYGLEVMELNQMAALPRDLKACATYDKGLETAASLNIPTICIFAEKDKMTPVKFGKALAGALSNNEMHIIANSGHTLPHEKPREVNALLRGFLERIDS
ncbi:MAG: alpha/beta hydrolase [Salaquimonas sp.]